MSKYIIIPEKVYQSNLNTTEMIVYGFILSMSQKSNTCYARNTFFEQELKMSKQKIQRAIKKLVQEDFIIKEMRGLIRHLIPQIAIETSKMKIRKSNLKPNSVINDTKSSIINDTHNNIPNSKKNNKSIKESIDSFSLSSSNQEKVDNLLIRCIEHLNKRYLNIKQYEIKQSEYKHINFLSELFKNYLGSSIKSIDVNSDIFFKYLYSFYLDLRANIYKNDDHSKRKRYYPYRFKGMHENLQDFSYQLSRHKKKDYLNFKEELDNNDNYDPYANSVINIYGFKP